jgi:hypothetical protein
MGLIQRMLSGLGKDKKEFKEKYKEAEMQMKIEKRLEERSKSSNKRELERYYRDEEEALIKKQLAKIHKKQNQDTWKSNTILTKGASMLKDDRPILKEENIFVDNKVPKQHSMGFFK